MVVGLPGAGKSHYVQAHSGPWAVRVEDYWKDSLPTGSRHQASILTALQGGQNCLIADIEFCNPARREEVRRTLQKAIPALRIEHHYFANDPAQCKLNVEERARNDPQRDASGEKRKIEQLSARYRIPPGAPVMPVWRPSAVVSNPGAVEPLR